MSEVGLLFSPYQQRSRLQSNTYQAITHLFTLFDQHEQSLNNNLAKEDAIEPNNGDIDTEEGEISDDNHVPEEESVDAESEEGEISDSGDVDDDMDGVEAESGEHNLEEAKKRCTGTYEKFMLSILSPGACVSTTAGKVVPENAVAKTSSSSSMNSVVQAGGNKKEKRKRGAMTEGRKAKRRKQRAEQDKQNGVKRLKLEIVTKPKTVNHCRFFIYGKCQQGEACKFSHDTTPLTKARPCNFHALGKCLKGDDCPYDHELFKYLCDNYKNKGFCGRGDSCLFSHKIGAVDEASQVTSDVNGIGKESLILVKEQNKRCTSQQILNRPKNRTLKTPGNLESNARQPPPPTQTPQGLSSLSVSSTPSADSSNRQKRKLNVAGVNDANNGTPEKYRNGSEVLGRKPTTPAQPPKGISFLSFPSTLSRNFNTQQNREQPIPRVNGAVGSINNGASEKKQNMNEMIGRKPTQPPKGITSLSFQKTPNTMQISELPVAQENGAGRQPPLTFPSSQSLKMVAAAEDKHTSNPWASKALFSTSRSTYDCKLTNSSIQPPPSNGSIPVVSSILQEFLFNGDKRKANFREEIWCNQNFSPKGCNNWESDQSSNGEETVITGVGHRKYSRVGNRNIASNW